MSMGAPVSGTFVSGGGSGGGSATLDGLTDVDPTGKASGEFLKWNGTNWVPDAIPGGGDLLSTNNLNDVSNAATARTNLGLAIGTNVQAHDAQLDDVAGLTPTDGNFIVGNGTNFIAESGATARTSLGLGNVEDTALSTWAGSSNVTTLGTVTTGTWNGTDIAVADGGSGRGTATAYSVLCGGTTATGAHQSVSSVGTSGQVLTSNGAGALPTWQAGGSGNTSKVVPGVTVSNCNVPSSNPAILDRSHDTVDRLYYDDTTEQTASWQFVMPQDYGSSFAVRLIFSCEDVQTGSKTVVWGVQVDAFTPDTTNADVATRTWSTEVTGTHNLASGQAAGYPRVLTISPNMDSAAAGSICWVKVAHKAGTSTVTGNVELIGIALEYTEA